MPFNPIRHEEEPTFVYAGDGIASKPADEMKIAGIAVEITSNSMS